MKCKLDFLHYCYILTAREYYWCKENRNCASGNLGPCSICAIHLLDEQVDFGFLTLVVHDLFE